MAKSKPKNKSGGGMLLGMMTLGIGAIAVTGTMSMIGNIFGGNNR